MIFMAADKIILWDVYGTLIVAPRGDLESLLRRQDELSAAFDETASRYSLTGNLQQWFDAIRTSHAESRARGVAHPEIRIEEIWRQLSPGLSMERAREVALHFENRANPKRLMPEAFDTLVALRQRGVRQGIISNAQFYTRLELTALLRAESDCADCSYEAIFDSALVFYSCDLGVAKPDLSAFRLARERIGSAKCLFVGDSPVNDIEPARQVGFTGLLFGPDGDIQRLSQILERV